MKQKPRVPEESRKRPGQTGSPRSLLPNDGSERRPMQSCEPSSVRTFGRFTEWAREPRLPKPKELSVNSVDREGGCAGDVSCLTRGGPLWWTSDNYDRVVRSESARRIDATGGVRRTHSSRKTTCRRRSWRHEQRRKQVVSAVGVGRPHLQRRRRGERRNVSVPMPSRSASGQEKEQPPARQPERISARQLGAWPLTAERKRKAAWTN